jgi:hypothetical protein
MVADDVARLLRWYPCTLADLRLTVTFGFMAVAAIASLGGAVRITRAWPALAES